MTKMHEAKACLHSAHPALKFFILISKQLPAGHTAHARTHTHCCGLCVSLKFTGKNPNTRCDGAGPGAFRRCLGQEGGAPGWDQGPSPV